MKTTLRKQYQQNYFKKLILAITIIGLLFPSSGNVFAQDGDGSTTLSFEQLGFSAIQLSSKLVSLSQSTLSDGVLNFSLPYRWVLTEGEANYIDLRYSVSAVRDDLANAGLSAQLPMLEVYMDGTLIGSFAPPVGLNQSTRIELPAALLNQKTSNQHKLQFVYLNVRDCIEDVEYLLNIYADSSLALTYTEAAPVLVLSDFPRPLVQDGFLAESLSFVLPDEHGDADLTVVATIAEAIGERGNGDLLLNVFSASEISSGAVTSGNLIVVGQPQENQFLANLYQQNLFPTTLSEQGTILGPEGLTISSDDGVLQLANNNGTLVLAVTGNSDQAIDKAATALASANPIYGLSSNLAVISEVYEEMPVSSQSSEDGSFLFSDLGLQDAQVLGVGIQSVGATFYLPHNWKILDDPSLTIFFSSSANLNANSSIINVELNNKLVGSIPLTNEVLGKKSASIQLRPEQFLPGEKNRLKLTVIMDNNLDCSQSNDLLAWFQLFSDSKLDIPHEVLTAFSEEAPRFSNPFFYLLSSDKSSKILFVTPAEVSEGERQGMAQLAYLLGREQNRNSVEILVVSDSAYVAEEYTDFQTVMIGRPTTNTAIATLNEYLVQPFVEGEDTLQQGLGNVKYVLPPSYSIGVIQAFASPVNPEKGITVISGTTDEALAWSLNAMSAPDLVRQLKGDLAFVYQDNIEAILSDTATNKAVEVMMENVTEQAVTTIDTTDPASASDPLQNLATNAAQSDGPSLLVIGLLVLVIAGVAGTAFSFVSRLRKSKSKSQQ